MIRWEEHTWPEIEDMLSRLKAVIVPVGSIEQHGPHLPLACDTIGAYKLSLEVAKRFDESILVLPPIYYGVSEHHMDFPGTITISPSTLIALLCEICRSLRRHGVRKVIIINGHGGNVPALSIAMRRIREEEGIEAVLINPWELIGDVIEETIESDVWGHACEFETSLALVQMPELVRAEKIVDPEIRKLPKYVAIWSKQKIHTAWRTKEITNTGSIGYPSRASKEKGEKLWSAIVERVVDAIRAFIEKS